MLFLLLPDVIQAKGGKQNNVILRSNALLEHRTAHQLIVKGLLVESWVVCLGLGGTWNLKVITVKPDASLDSDQSKIENGSNLKQKKANIF